METFFPFHIPVLLGKLLFLALQEFNPAASKQMWFRKAALKRCMSLQSSLTDSPVTAIGLAGKTTAAHTAVHSVTPEAGKYQNDAEPSRYRSSQTPNHSQEIGKGGSEEFPLWCFHYVGWSTQNITKQTMLDQSNQNLPPEELPLQPLAFPGPPTIPFIRSISEIRSFQIIVPSLTWKIQFFPPQTLVLRSSENSQLPENHS